MTKLVCQACNYRFNSNPGRTPTRCPYCENKSVIEEPNAQDLINEEE